MPSIHYALQTCDLKSYQNLKRFVSDNRSEISKKSIKSFFQAINHCLSVHENIDHNVIILQDKISDELAYFIQDCIKVYSKEKIKIEIKNLKTGGIKNSIEECYHWLQQYGKNFVYQVQDDYLFSNTSIVEMIDLYNKILIETNSEPIITPFNDPYVWVTQYRNLYTPRVLIPGKHRYWVSIYDISCSFFTSHYQFSQHWDLYHKFFELIDDSDNLAYGLESKSLNYILTKRAVPAFCPINSLAVHLQTELEKDPFIDYKEIWDSIDIL